TITCGPSEQRLASQLRSRNRNINNGVKIPAEVDVESVGDEILSVGRVSIQKGFDIFKQIAAALPECRFVWMGSAEPADKHLLDDLPNNVTMVDYQPHDVTMERIRRARFVLLPSRWEGLSRVLLESIGFGRAIVTSHCEANVDCLAGPVQGATSRDAFEFDNGYACSHLEDYVAAITQLCSDPQLLRAKQAASLRHARRNFDMELIRRQWKDLYQLPSQSLSPALAPRLTT
ncbi:MAG: glycosyltransferase, partial [Planctomycetales bacterium]|nr:glycosyltransferase [Planctomycetales bacterium]